MTNTVKKVVKFSDDALDVIQSSHAASLFGDDLKQIQKKIQKIAWRSKKIQKSADRNAAISVYGPSQAGKSFLASVLVRPTDRPLEINFSGPTGNKEYISEINPSGDRECTGLVTRFTISSQHTNSDYPIQLRLLSELDIICILINSYFSDGEQQFENHKSKNDLLEYFKSIEGSRAAKTESICKEDFWELEEYLKENFSNFTYANTLLPFVELISERAVKSDISQKSQLYAPLWGLHQQFTDLYVRMMEALQVVNFCSELCASEAALIPKAKSIIDVQILRNITSTNDDYIDVQCPNGDACTLPRSLLSAVTAELVLNISDVPHEFMMHTDVLDFPGARNREPVNLTDHFASFEDDGNKIHEYLIRGKVAYLFEKYVNSQDINAMLLCIKHSNMEAIGLTTVVERWIKNSIGQNADQRTNTNNSFFFVMTFFDQHLVDTAANESETDRFTRRIHSSLLEKFGRLPDSWPLSWSMLANKSVPFDNCYWLRNPGVAQSYFTRKNGIEELSSNSTEDIRISQIKDMHSKTEEVITHFKDPSKAWDAVMQGNDGGVSYILRELSKVCNSEIKNEQLDNLAGTFSRELSDCIKDYYVPSDITERKAVAEEKIGKLYKEIDAISKENRFANFLEELFISQDQLNEWTQANTSTHVAEVLDGVCEQWHSMAKSFSRSIQNEYPISKLSIEFLTTQLAAAFNVFGLQDNIIQKAAFLDGMEGNQKWLSLNISALMINDFISAADPVPEQDPNSIRLSANRENIAKSFSLRWLANFEKIVEKNMLNLDGKIVEPQLNQKIGEILKGLE